MRQNVGPLDALLRGTLGVGLILGAAYYNDRPFLAIGLALIALVFLGTALGRSCPLYVLLGVNTCSRPTRPAGS